MKFIKETIINEIIINKSRFITNIFRVNSLEEINQILTATKKKYYDATHNCYAYILGDNQEIQKCSDDGEPSKTAGYPMLDVLKKKELTNVLAIVTRYYGGVMLGAGGLVRAYSNSVSDAIKNTKFYTLKELNIYSVTIDYSTYNLLNKFFEDKIILESTFTYNIILNIAFEKDKSPHLLNQLNDLTNGKAIVIYLKEHFIEVPCDNI